MVRQIGGCPSERRDTMGNTIIGCVIFVIVTTQIIKVVKALNEFVTTLKK